MSDLIKLARSRTAVIQTHWDGCERDHAECLIQRLADELERTRDNLKAIEDEKNAYIDYVGDALGQDEDGETLWDAAQRVLSERDRLRVEVERLQAQLAAATHVLSLCAFALRQPFDDWKGVHEANALNAINDFAVARKEQP